MKNSNCSKTGMALKSILAVLLSVGGLIVSAQEWQTCTPLPANRFEYACAAVNGTIYVVGGHTGNAISELVFYSKVSQDGVLSAWQAGNPLPAKLAYVTAAANKDKIYVLGGASKEGYSDKVFYATIKEDGTVSEWKETTPLPKKMHAGSVVIVKDTIYHIGGTWRGVWSAKINEDGSLGEWKDAQHLLSPRGSGVACTYNDNIYLCGGVDVSGTIKPDVFRTKVGMDGTLDKWEKMTELPFANSSMAAVLDGKKIILLGGGAGEDKVLSTTINANGDLGDWIEEKHPLPKPLRSFRAVYVNGWVYVIAGFSKSADGKPSVSNTVYRMKAQ